MRELSERAKELLKETEPSEIFDDDSFIIDTSEVDMEVDGLPNYFNEDFKCTTN